MELKKWFGFANETGKDDKEEDSPKISRRKFIRRSVAGTAAVVTAYSFAYEPWNIKIERHNLKVPNLPGFWRGKKLVQVTDIHCSDIIKYDFLKKSFLLIKKENPDILVFTGDYVSGSANYIDSLNKVLKETVTQNKTLCKIAVPGNHDYWTCISKVNESLKECGFTVLTNEEIRLGPPGSKLTIIGTDDYWNGTVDVAKQLKRCNPEKEAIILLSHNPDVFDEAAKNNVPITLSGHSHGGQINFPLAGPIMIPCKYAQGFYRKNGCLLYVNRGLGMWKIPVRLNCPPEITVFTLE